MGNVVIGVHGVANKPPSDQLAAWWEAAIREGLARNCGPTDADFVFEMVYWAKYVYRHPLHLDRDFVFDDLFNREPYLPADEGALKPYGEWMDESVLAKGLSFFGRAVEAAKEHFGMTGVRDWALNRTFKDLAYYYYDDPRPVRNRDNLEADPVRLRQALQEELTRALRKHSGKTILLIGHSMGSVIAYDVLRDLGREAEGIEISHFVTLGSPLCFPHVQARIREERGTRPDGTPDPDPVRAPTLVTRRWVNHADRRDPVTIDVRLADDYGPNTAGVGVEDELVYNDYRAPNPSPEDPDRLEENPHKSYGYLRTPEFSALMQSFLAEGSR